MLAHGNALGGRAPLRARVGQVHEAGVAIEEEVVLVLAVGREGVAARVVAVPVAVLDEAVRGGREVAEMADVAGGAVGDASVEAVDVLGEIAGAAVLDGGRVLQ